MFKVSKRPYQSSRHNEIICRWRHNPPGDENLNWTTLGENWVFVQLCLISCNLEAKFDYNYFITFLCYGSKTINKKFQAILSNNEGMTVIFLNFDLILNLKNQHQAFIFDRNDLRFFV